MENIYGRLVTKQTNKSSIIGTIPTSNDYLSGFSSGSWISSDLINGEFYVNTTDKKVFVRTNNSITELMTGNISLTQYTLTSTTLTLSSETWNAINNITPTISTDITASTIFNVYPNDLNIMTSSGNSNNTASSINIITGNGVDTNGGNYVVTLGSAANSYSYGGAYTVTTGSADVAGAGNITYYTGSGSSSGNFVVNCGVDNNNNEGAKLFVNGANNNNGGNAYLFSGSGSSSGNLAGSIYIVAANSNSVSANYKGGSLFFFSWGWFT